MVTKCGDAYAIRPGDVEIGWQGPLPSAKDKLFETNCRAERQVLHEVDLRINGQILARAFFQLSL